MRRKKNNFIGMFLILIMSMGLLSACGDTKTSNEVESTEVQTEDNNITEETETIEEVTYKEYDSYFIVSDLSHCDNTYVDNTILDWSTWERVGKTIHIEDSINIYNDEKAMVGYTKPNVDAIYVTTNGEWGNLAIGESGFCVYVRTDELESSISTEDETVTKDTNTSTEVDSEPTYTVTEMNKTMYAKQSVNLRSGPSSEYEKIGSLKTNDEVTVTGQADTGWYRLDYNGGVAFVSNNYLSDTKVEVAPSDDGGNTDEDENNSEEESIPPTDDNTNEDVVPEEPTYNYTAEEVIAIVRSTLESNGFMWSLDYAPPEAIEQWGPSLGMGWGYEYVPMNDPYTYANSMVEGAVYWGYNMYYLEYQNTEDGCVILKSYWGTRSQ